MSDGETERDTHTLNFAIAGALSGLFTRAIGQPLDVVKIRFQLQTEPISKKFEYSKYTGTVQAFRLIMKEEGIHGLWRGHLAAQLLSVTYGIVQFQVYESSKIKLADHARYYGKNYNIDTNSLIHFICGGAAGCCATVASFPFDVLRTRLVAQGNNKHYTGIFHGLVSLYKHEGILSYWRGLSPALIVAGPFIGFQFTFYEFFKNIIVYFNAFSMTSNRLETNSHDVLGVRNGTKETNAFGKLVAGSISGLCAKTLTYPFDLARKRMQMQEFQYARVGFGSNFWCSSLITCFVTTLRKESIFGIYKGLFPSLVKSSVNTALHFMFYEECLRLLNKYR